MLVHDRLGSHGLADWRGRPEDHLWRWRPVAQGRVRPAGVVVPPPTLDDDLGFGQRVEELAVEQLVAKLAVEAFAIPILPRAAGLDVGRPGTHRGDPRPDGLGRELRTVVG